MKVQEFRAAVLCEHLAPLSIETICAPAELNAGQVLVRVHASGICGAQLGEIAGVKGPDKYLPHLLGHEGAGRVLACGPGVTHVKAGDRVVMHWRKGTGIDAAPPTYVRAMRSDQPRVGGGGVTTFNERAVVSENRLTPIAEDIPYDIAALMGCAVTTGLGLISHEARVKIGQSVLVIGCGGVGLNVIQGAALAGAHPIVGVDTAHEKGGLIFKFGGTHAFLKLEGVRSVLSAGADICIDTTGIPEVIELAFELTAPGGVLYLVGQVRFDQRIQIPTLPMHSSGKTIVASDGGHTNPSIDIPRYLNLYRAGKLKLNELITHRAPLDNVNYLLDRIRRGHVGRALIEMGGPDQ